MECENPKEKLLWFAVGKKSHFDVDQKSKSINKSTIDESKTFEWISNSSNRKINFFNWKNRVLRKSLIKLKWVLVESERRSQHAQPTLYNRNHKLNSSIRIAMYFYLFDGWGKTKPLFHQNWCSWRRWTRQRWWQSEIFAQLKVTHTHTHTHTPSRI